jgi:hypothetical protein
MRIADQIFENKDADKIIKTELNEALVNNLLNSYSGENSTRSSKRSDELHLSLEIILKKLYSPSSLSANKVEINIDSKKSSTKIPSSSGKSKTYSVDLLVKQNQQNKIAVEVAAAISSFNKNYDNNLNKLMGRAIRVFSNKKNIEDELEFYQIDFIPRYAPVFNNKSDILKIEEVNIAKPEDDEDYDSSLLGEFVNRQKIIKVIYTVNPEIYSSEIKNKKELYDKIKETDRDNVIISIEVEEIKYFYKQIGKLLTRK